MKTKPHRLSKRQQQVQLDDYLARFTQLEQQAVRFKKMGLKVKMVLPDFSRRPLLVIEKPS